MDRYVEIKSGSMEMVLNADNGNIVQIKSNKTGLVHFDTAGKNKPYEFLFRLIIPLENWYSHFADNLNTKPEITKKNGELSLLYKNLKATTGKNTGINVLVKIYSVEENEEFKFQITVENKGNFIINEVCFPVFNGWQGNGKDVMVSGGFQSFDPYSFPNNWPQPFLRLRNRAFFDYPAHMFVPWFDISGKKGGFSCINYMESPLNCGVFLENMEGYTRNYSLSCGWVFYPLIKKGNKWTSPLIGISSHNKDWHETADRYISWAEKWYKAPPTPLSAKIAIGTQNVFLRGFDGTPFNKIESIPEIARIGREYGVNHLCLWDFAITGIYTQHGDVELLNYTKKEEKELKKGIMITKKEGTNVSALINFRLINYNNKLPGKEILRDIVKTYDGCPKIEAYPAEHCTARYTRPFMGPFCYVASYQAKSQVKRVLDLTKKYIDLGFNSMFYDQPFEVWPNYNLKDPDDSPDRAYEAVVNLLGKVRQMLYKNDPESIMMGEYCEIFASQYIDTWMTWFSSFDMANYVAYSIPMTINSWVVDSDKGQSNRAFASGLHLLLCTHGIEKPMNVEPEFALHIKALAELRRLTAGRTVLGRYKDVCGIEILKGEELAIKRFDSKEGAALIIADYTGKGGSAHVKVDIEKEPFKEGIIFRLDGRRQYAEHMDELKIDLKPYEVVVWFV